MAINLLPSEQKLKLKKQKSDSRTHFVEMTEPEKIIKNKPAVKSGGVLGFFKQAFRTPKVEINNKNKKDESVSIESPATKILLKEKISYKNNRRIPKVEYHVPSHKKESLKKKTSFQFGNKISNIFDQQKIKRNNQVAIIGQPAISAKTKEQFPKYHSVSTEKLLAQKDNSKNKKAKVIEIISESTKDENGNKKTKPTIWETIQNWFSKFFSHKKSIKPKPDLPKISNLSGLPKPKDKQLEITYKKKITKQDLKEEIEDKKLNLNNPIVQPKVVLPKNGLLPYDIPKEHKNIPLQKEVKIEVEKTTPKENIKPELSFVKSPVPKTVIKREKQIEKKAKKVVKSKKSQRNYLSWFTKFWQSIILWFSSVKKPKKNHKHSSHKIMTNVDENTEVPNEKNKQSFDQINFNKLPEQSKLKIESISPPSLPPSNIKELPSLSKDNTNLPDDRDIEEAKKKSSPVFENNDVSIPLPPLKVDNSNLKENEKEEIPQPSLTSAEMISGMDWEVNLVPEDEQKQNIPISKILYLILVVVVTSSLVFGGWLYANYYYNNISTAISEVDVEISLKEANISKYNQLQQEARVIQDKITTVQDLLDKHIYWSEFFNQLEFYTISNVYYNSMSVDVNGTVTLSAVGSSYENAIKQLMVMEKASDFVTKVTISDITFQSSAVALDENSVEDNSIAPSDDVNVSFNINLMVQPDIFYYPKINL